jgi:hypothetical protein
MDAAQIASFGQLPEDEPWLVLASVIARIISRSVAGMLSVAV